MISKKTFAGKVIAITRSSHQASEWHLEFERLGATVLELPLLDITPHKDPVMLKEVFAELGQYEWIVFTSKNGVENFFGRFFDQFEDIRCIGGMRIACIGGATARAVRKYRLQTDLIPEKSTLESLTSALLEKECLDNVKILVITGNRNRTYLVETLEKEGRAIVDTLQVYSTQMRSIANTPAAKAFCEEGADALIFTSPSAVESFLSQAAKLQLNPNAKRPIACSMGPQTTEALKKASMTNFIEAKTQSLSGIIDILKEKL